MTVFGLASVPSSLASFFEDIVRTRLASDCLRFVAAIFLAARPFGAAFFRAFSRSFKSLEGLSELGPRCSFQILVIPWGEIFWPVFRLAKLRPYGCYDPNQDGPLPAPRDWSSPDQG